MDTLDLPTGATVTPEDVFHYEGYPYRFRPSDDADTAFLLVPLYWGGSGMDVRVPSEEAFAAEWSEQSRGVLDDEEWRGWLADARTDDRYGDEELDAVARELGVEDVETGLIDRLRRAFGR